jgi:hypothetical protein
MSLSFGVHSTFLSRLQKEVDGIDELWIPTVTIPCLCPYLTSTVSTQSSLGSVVNSVEGKVLNEQDHNSRLYRRKK